MDVHIEGTEQVEIVGMRASLQCVVCGHSWGVTLVGPDHNHLPPQALRCSQCGGSFITKDGTKEIYEHANFSHTIRD
jgi:hypothetical protein